MQGALVQFLSWEDLLEKGLATHSSILGPRPARPRSVGDVNPRRSRPPRDPPGLISMERRRGRLRRARPAPGLPPPAPHNF